MSDLGLCDLCHVRIIHQSITQLSYESAWIVATDTGIFELWRQLCRQLNEVKGRGLTASAGRAWSATASVGVQRSRVIACNTPSGSTRILWLMVKCNLLDSSILNEVTICVVKVVNMRHTSNVILF